MPCSCNSKKAATNQNYVVTVDGESKTYNSKVEAEAAAARAGAGATLVPA